MKHIQDPTASENTIDVYRAGLWRDVHNARGRWLHDPQPGAKLAALKSLCRWFLRSLFRRTTWRDRRNYFNGFLAEPLHWPEGLTRCGSGWTRKRALASLYRLTEEATRDH